MNSIEIYAPRFSRKDVLIAPHRVQTGLNRIIFTRTWQGKEFFMDGERIRSYPLESNSAIMCHAIPIADFATEPTQLKLEIK